MGDGVEGFNGALGAARKIEDQRSAANCGRAAGKNRTRSFLQTFAPHLFRESRNHFVGNRFRRFGSHIARAEPGAARGENQVHLLFVGEAFEGDLYLKRIVGYEMSRSHSPAQFLAARDDRGSGGVERRTARESVRSG